MVAKASQQESGQEAGEGIEIVRNEPFDEKSDVNKYNMPPGQYTYVLLFRTLLQRCLRIRTISVLAGS